MSAEPIVVVIRQTDDGAELTAVVGSASVVMEQTWTVVPGGNPRGQAVVLRCEGTDTAVSSGETVLSAFIALMDLLGLRGPIEQLDDLLTKAESEGDHNAL